MRKKIMLAGLLRKVSPPRILERLALRATNCLRVLAYHRVLDIQPEAFAFDEEIVSASTAQFEEQMEFVGRHFVLLTFHNVLDYQRRGKPLPRRSLIVTFDDGYEDNYRNAFPILQKYNIPGTFFVATDYVGNGDVFWFEKLAYWIKRTTQPELRLRTPPAPEFSLSLQDRNHSLERLRLHLMGLDNETRLQALLETEEQLGVKIHPEDKRWVTTMNWEQLKEMNMAGCEIGSHTQSHPVLSRLSPGKLNVELCASKRRIESETGAKVVSLAYPFGGREVFNNAVKEAAADAGYAFGISYLSGVNQMDTMDPFEVKRIHVETATTMDLFECELLFPKVFVK